MLVDCVLKTCTKRCFAVKLGIVVAEFNWDVTGVMLEAALARAKEKKIETIAVKVPGSFEIPLAAKRLLEKGVDGVVTLGAIIQGGTSHDEVIAYPVAEKLLELSLHYGKPVALGVAGPRMSREQARSRAESFGRNTVDACAKMIEEK